MTRTVAMLIQDIIGNGKPCTKEDWRVISKEIKEALTKAPNRSSMPCGDCNVLLPLNLECDNPSCVRVIMRHGIH